MSSNFEPVQHSKLSAIASEAEYARIDEARDMARELLALRTKAAMLEMDLRKAKERLRDAEVELRGWQVSR